MPVSGYRFYVALFWGALVLATQGCARWRSPAPAVVTSRPSASAQLITELRRATDQLQPFCTQSMSCALTIFRERGLGASQVGEYLADKMTAVMSEAGLSLVERSRLDSAIDELKITGQGLISDKTAKSIGALVSADTIIVGTLTVDADIVELHTRGVDSESGKIVKTSDLRFPLAAVPAKLVGQPARTAPQLPLAAPPSEAPAAKVPSRADEPSIAYEDALRASLFGMATYIERVRKSVPALGFATANGSILLGARLRAGEEARLVHAFSAGRTYVILGQANEKSSTVGLRVMSEDGQVTEAAATDPSALLTFTPHNSGEYTLEVTYRGLQPDSTGVVTVAVLRKEGTQVPDASLYASVQAAFDAAHQWRRPRMRQLQLRTGWSYIALVLEPDQAHTMGDFLIVGHDALVAAAADQTAQNIDVSVLNQNSRVIAAEAAAGRSSIVAYGAENQNIRIKTYAQDTARACMVSLLLLDVR